MKKLILLIISGWIITSGTLFAQNPSVKDSSILMSMFKVSYAYQLPGGDLIDRFGANSNIGGGIQLKTKSNWLFDADFNYIFGENVKNEDELFHHLHNDAGFIINGSGEITDYVVYERGYYLKATIGKLIPAFGINPNSGFFIKVGGGYLRHKIRIDVENNSAPQLKDDYKKGYDHLSAGIMLSELIGYQYIDNKKLINFYVGFEFNQAWTQSLRKYNYNSMSFDNEKRNDLLNGLRVGILIPFYKRQPQEFYYY